MSKLPRRKKPKPIPPRKRPKKERTTADYVLLEVPENPGLFAVQRRALGAERFAAADPHGRELGPIYTAITYLVSPFFNYDTQRPGESCTCLAWRQRHRRCIHLRKFFEMNPHLTQPDIFEDTTIPVDELAEVVANDTVPANEPALRKRLARELADFANDWYHNNPTFREWLSPCRKVKTLPNEGSPAQIKREFLEQLTQWAKDHDMVSQQPINFEP